MSRMFKSITQTWNVFVGCKFDCTYCNARKTALTRFKHLDRYKDGFEPHIIWSEFAKTFKPGEFIFVGYMGDIAFATDFEIGCIIEEIKTHPDTRFLLCTKNPCFFYDPELRLPENVVIATTIETNRDYHLSKAPPPSKRYWYLKSVVHPHKMVSIEPIMDFDLDVLSAWIANIAPEIIEVGADNYHNHLPEPSPEKVNRLLANLREFCPTVIEKDGLNRLKERR